MNKEEIAKLFVKCDIENDIEKIKEANGCSYMEAIILYCEEKDISPEDINCVLPDVIRERFKVECLDLKLVKGTKQNSLDEYL